MINQQIKRFEFPDYKLIELSADDLRELNFSEYVTGNGNVFFSRYDKNTKQLVRLKQLSGCFEVVSKTFKGKKIKRWYDLVELWFDITNESILRMNLD